MRMRGLFVLMGLSFLSACTGLRSPTNKASGSTSSTSSQLPGNTGASGGVSSTEPAEKGESTPLIRLDQRVQQYLQGFYPDNPAARFRGEVYIAKGEQKASQQSLGNEIGQRYAIGSISKCFTAVAIRQLEQSGALSLTDSVRIHIPELPEEFDLVSIRQLLIHKGGTGNYLTPEIFEVIEKGQSQSEMIQRIADAGLEFEPGTQAKYSNSGYYLLGIVIERTSKQSLGDYFAQKIFTPAGMSQSDLKDEKITVGHEAVNGQVVPAPRSHPSISFSAGAVSASAMDVAAFGRALAQGKLLPPAIVQEMWQPLASVGPMSFGMGFMVVWKDDALRLVGHNGATMGHASNWWMTPDALWNSVTLSNLRSVNVDRINNDLMLMALTDKYVEPPLEQKALPFDPQLATALAGEYALDPLHLPELEKSIGPKVIESLKTITWSGTTKYSLKPVGQGAFVVEQIEPGVFYSAPLKATITLSEKDGAITGFVLEQAKVLFHYLKS